MRRIPCGVLVLLVLSSFAACAPVAAHGAAPQGPTTAARKRGTIFKDEVDGLVAVLSEQARASNTAIGGDSVLATAKMLAAMSKCHRRYYYPGDVPAVTQSVDFLIRHRQQDGRFGDADSTVWTIEALTRLPVEPMFQDEIAQAKAWHMKQSTPATGFDLAVRNVLDQVRADVFPQQLGSEAAAKAKAWIASPAGMVHVEAAEALLQLVACQVANKQLDKAQDPSAGGGSTAWAPSQQRAAAWLLSQLVDGVYRFKQGDKSFPDPALTGFAMMALQCKPKAMRTADEQNVIDKGMKWLLATQNADGTFGQQLPNYTTCAVVGALHRWGDPAAEAALTKAQKAILSFQHVETTGYQKGDRDYGSIGYGGAQRGDLSNLHFSLEALRQTGLPENNEAFQKAITFLQRTQNLKAVNDFHGKVPDPDREGVVLDATSGDDGGAGYYPGNSAAGYIVQPDGKSVPRSYGSMTYALLKSYTLAGVKGDDARVQAAVKWIQDNWTLAVNPGADPAMGEKARYQGLFYYYMVLAQALDAAKVATVKATTKDDKGVAKTEDVDWRKLLRSQLDGMQQTDGSWVNGKNERWMESMPFLCTCYALLALEHCK